MTMAEYLRSVRTLTQDEVNQVSRERDVFDFDAQETYDAHAGHAEYGGSHH